MNLLPFLTDLKIRLNDYKTRLGFNYFREYDVVVETGRKYHKIFRSEIPHDLNTRNIKLSIVAFVDKETGAIYKPATFKSPAKHARGFVNSPQNGMEAIDQCGSVLYLR
jgi:hypothetical protein